MMVWPPPDMLDGGGQITLDHLKVVWSTSHLAKESGSTTPCSNLFYFFILFLYIFIYLYNYIFIIVFIMGDTCHNQLTWYLMVSVKKLYGSWVQELICYFRIPHGAFKTFLYQKRKNKKHKLITKHRKWKFTTKDRHRRQVTGRISMHGVQIWRVGCMLQRVSAGRRRG